MSRINGDKARASLQKRRRTVQRAKARAARLSSRGKVPTPPGSERDTSSR